MRQSDVRERQSVEITRRTLLMLQLIRGDVIRAITAFIPPREALEAIAVTDGAIEVPAPRPGSRQPACDLLRHLEIPIDPPADELHVERPERGAILEPGDRGGGHGEVTRERAGGSRKRKPRT